MRKTNLTVALAAIAASMAFAGAAHADGTDNSFVGKIQVKLLATAVLPTGSVSSVPNDAAGLVSGGLVTQTSASDNVVPTIAIEYFATPNVSVETICCVSGHHVTATGGALAGTVLVDNAQVIPATFTLKYHFNGLGAIHPYIGAGPSLFLWINDRPSAPVQGVGVTRTKLSSEVGAALQAGVDVPVGHGYSLSLDAKRYFMKTTAHFDTATADVEDVRINLNPWVLSAGVAYRF